MTDPEAIHSIGSIEIYTINAHVWTFVFIYLRPEFLTLKRYQYFYLKTNFYRFLCRF